MLNVFLKPLGAGGSKPSSLDRIVQSSYDLGDAKDIFKLAQSVMREERIPLTSFSTNEKEFHFEIPSTMLQATPTWVPESEAVPLSPREAIRLGMPHAQAQRPKFDSCICTSVAITSVESHSKSSHWFYFLHFLPVMDGRTYYSDAIPVVLLLDGSVVEPRVTDPAHD